MKTRVIFPEFVIHTTPLEKINYNNEKHELCIYLDDEKERRWCIKATICIAVDIVNFDCSYWQPQYFPEECFEKKRGMLHPRFKNHILESENSSWLRAFVKNEEMDGLFKDMKHFIVSLYETQIDFWAQIITLEELKNERENKIDIEANERLESGEMIEWDNVKYHSCVLKHHMNEKTLIFNFEQCEAIRIRVQEKFVRKAEESKAVLCEYLKGESLGLNSSVFEAKNSEWVRELKTELKKKEPQGTCLEKIRHFVLRPGNTIFECCALSVQLRKT